VLRETRLDNLTCRAHVVTFHILVLSTATYFVSRQPAELTKLNHPSHYDTLVEISVSQ
jgi:hypothetical protein